VKLNRTSSTSIAIAIVGITLFAALVLRRTQERQLTEVRIRLHWTDQAQFAGLYVAQDKGFFAKQGLNVVLEPGGVLNPVIQSVAAGENDFGVVGAEELILARSKLLPIKGVAVIFQESPFCLAVLRDSGILDLSDLVKKGGSIGIQPGNDEIVVYQAMLQNAKLDGLRIKETEVGYDPALAASGAVTAWPSYSFNEPVILKLLYGKETKLIWPRQYGIESYGDTLFTTEHMISTHRDVVRSIVAATVEGWAYAIENPDYAIDATLRRDKGLRRDVQRRGFDEVIRLVKGRGLSIGSMRYENWRSMDEMLVKAGFVEHDVDFGKAYTSEFVQ
jgi:NitT/TauT family transport system substrate-binding protein